jgi:Tfp pilus assembly protein PilO
MPVILIGISLALFLVFTNPLYRDIAELRTAAASYDEALNNSKALENERDKLTAKYNSMNPDHLKKLEKFLPENIENIRLILEIEQVALPYGMVLRDIKYSPDESSASDAELEAEGAIEGGGAVKPADKDYGVWDLEFSTVGTYNNFLNFLRDLESNLRIIDISSIQFSSSAGISEGPVSSLPSSAAPVSSAPGAYKYDFKIKTYWLKD